MVKAVKFMPSLALVMSLLVTNTSASALVSTTTTNPPTSATTTPPSSSPTPTQPAATTPSSSMQSQTSVPTPGQSPTQTVNIATTDYSGQILKVSTTSLTIDTANGSKQFQVPGNVKIQRNASTALLSELKPGDKVVVKATDTGEVLAISATAGSVINTGKTVLGILILLLILAAIVAYVLRKRNRGFIKTVPTKI